MIHDPIGTASIAMPVSTRTTQNVVLAKADNGNNICCSHLEQRTCWNPNGAELSGAENKFPHWEHQKLSDFVTETTFATP